MTTNDSVRVEIGPKRVRAMLGGEVVADTSAPRLVWEHRYYPAYYFPTDDVSRDLLVPSSERSHHELLGDAVHYTVKAGGASAPDAAWSYPDSPVEEIRDLVRIDWGAMDAWFEESEEVFVHPRSPYARIDVLDSSRHVQVEIDGTIVADSHHPKLLFETGLPTRYYLPKTDVRLDLLSATDTETSCPYKGNARWWSVTVDGTTHDDVVWSYPTPLPESIKAAGLMCFYNERVDLIVDGERLERAKTHFS